MMKVRSISVPLMQLVCDHSFIHSFIHSFTDSLIQYIAPATAGEVFFSVDCITNLRCNLVTKELCRTSYMLAYRHRRPAGEPRFIRYDIVSGVSDNGECPPSDLRKSSAYVIICKLSSNSNKLQYNIPFQATSEKNIRGEGQG